MYAIDGSGLDSRVLADSSLSLQDFRMIADELARRGLVSFRVRKLVPIAARQVGDDPTPTNAQEDANARRGDWLVTTLRENGQVAIRDGRPDRYIIKDAVFRSLYEPDGGSTEEGGLFRSIADIDAIELPAGLDIMASWGERLSFASGFLLSNGAEVYGADKDTFWRLFERCPSEGST